MNDKENLFVQNSGKLFARIVYFFGKYSTLEFISGDYLKYFETFDKLFQRIDFEICLSGNQ